MDRFKSIKTLIAVVDGDSFVAASRMLGVSESTTSRRIADLETYLGTRLVYRDAHRLLLTEPGEAFVARCRRRLAPSVTSSPIQVWLSMALVQLNESAALSMSISTSCPSPVRA